ncbi:TlpA disulfide reductase family protein [Haloterrigena salinisoli]|uniref:TlpA family protein disulfide reductase n=1 Tax=Haloterrigena salinisoli TaxID=3132747 RepID=UPI0030CD1004
MRRRDVLAGVASLGIVGGGGAVALHGLPTRGDRAGTDSENDDGSESANVEPLAIETVEAPGSEAGEVRIPASDRPTFIDFFGTWCAPCSKQMPALVEANDRVGDEVLFISVTSESISDEKLVDWWEEHDGNWLLGLDPTAELTTRYDLSAYPFAVAIDASGRVRYSDSGIKTADELVSGIEQAIDASDG